ncbi:MAG TPA: hypothetical protein VEV39_12000 [Gemmatimonadales bacterium]|nr:hypothetical protein [Gemmatimonadales bacterium]
MNRLASVLFALALVSAPAAVQAQENSGQTNLVLSIFGGISAGHSLWSIARQPLCVLQGSGGNYSGCEQFVSGPDSGNLSDTLSFARDVSSSLMLGATVSLFPNSHIGFQGEIYYLGLSFDDRCANAGAPYQSDPENKNEQLCNSFSATGASASAVSFIGGVVLRASPHHAISPYLRAGVGLTSYSGGTLSVTGQFAVTDPATGQLVLVNRAVVVDTTPKTTSWTLQFGAGITARMSPGYQFRMELRDAVVPLERLIGPANDFGQAPHETKIYHHLGLIVGLDVVLEHRRSHRY